MKHTLSDRRMTSRVIQFSNCSVPSEQLIEELIYRSFEIENVMDFSPANFLLFFFVFAQVVLKKNRHAREETHDDAQKDIIPLFAQ